MKLSLIMNITSIFLLAGCATVAHPEVPVIKNHLSKVEAEQMKRDYRVLANTRDGIGIEGGQNYPLFAFGPVVKVISPEAGKTFDTGFDKAIGALLLDSGGWFIVGMGLGSTLRDQFTQTSTWELAGGATAILGGFLLRQNALHDLGTAIELYNEELNRKIEQSSEPQPIAP